VFEPLRRRLKFRFREIRYELRTGGLLWPLGPPRFLSPNSFRILKRQLAPIIVRKPSQLERKIIDVHRGMHLACETQKQRTELFFSILNIIVLTKSGSIKIFAINLKEKYYEIILFIRALLYIL
jgi:hypothetical protein